ncbi:MAG TPA: type II secretion system F family protein [Acidobacteriaceae bacterium]|jgi:tight adherence protein C
MSQVLLSIAIMIGIFSALALIATLLFVRQTPESQRVLDVVQNNRVEVIRDAGNDINSSKNSMTAVRNLRVKLGLSESSNVKKRLVTAGLRKGNSADIYYAAQMALPLLGIIAGTFMPSNKVFMALVFGVIGFMAPDFWLSRQVSKRKNIIRRGLPDSLDLLVICVEAGLGLDQALLRVGEEMVISHPQIAEELTLVNLEQRAGKPRLEAWQALAERTEVEEFASFVSMLTQTERFGTPIIKTLSRFAEDLRTQRRQRAEEAAAKTKIKIIFPLVLCIFPCIFIVLLAPAVLSIMNGLSNMNGGH